MEDPIDDQGAGDTTEAGVKDQLVRPAQSGSSRRSILEPSARSYGFATGQSAVHNASQPWRVVGAVALDAVRGAMQPREESGSTASGRDMESGGPKLYHETDAQRRQRSQTGPSPDVSASKPGVLDSDCRGEAQHLLQDQQDLETDNMDKPMHAELHGTPDTPGPKEPPNLEGRHDEDASSNLATESVASTGYTQQAVMLRLETVSAGEAKAIFMFVYVSILIGLVALFAEFAESLHLDPDGGAMRDLTARVIDVAVGGVCFVVLSCTLSIVLARVWRGKQLGKTWTARRRKAAILTFAEVGTQWVNVIFWLLPNIYLLVRQCDWTTRIVPWAAAVRWTCWNTIFVLFVIHGHNGNPWPRDPNLRISASGTIESTIKDAPLRYHAPKLILWLIMETLVLTCSLWYAYGPETRTRRFAIIPPGQERNCDMWVFHCSNTATQKALVILMVAAAILHLAFFALFISRTWRALRERSFNDFRMEQLIARLQIRMRGTVAAFFVLSMVLLWLARADTCTAFSFTWLGLLPMQVVMSAVATSMTFYCMPKDPDKDPRDQVALSEFAWTEADKAAKLKARCASGLDDPQLRDEPMFCMETAMKAFYWTGLVYDYQEAGDKGLSLETALGLWDLQHSELFWEKELLDTKCLLAWNADTCVLAFRGTASFANAWADIQAWRTVHPPRRGHYWLGTQPLVHAGFLRSWLAGGLNDRVTGRVLEVLTEERGKKDQTFKRVFVTGHSLGGALGVLASYDLSKALQAAGLRFHLACYTFGAPRTGNHAFARDYQTVVPDAWSIINDQDVVARGAKFVMMYKRPGQRVIINRIGDMLVRPGFLEASLHQVPAGSSVAHHLLSNYQRSFLAVLLGQFGSKRFRDGPAGVVALARASQPVQELLLERAGLSIQELQRMSRWGALAPRVYELKRTSRQGAGKGPKGGGGQLASSMGMSMGSRHGLGSKGSTASGRSSDRDAAAAAAVANAV